MEETEKNFLQNYDITKYERPSVAADIATFSIINDTSENYRKLPEKHLNLLLIKRGEPPFEGMWALPGGFLRPNETLDQTAERELKEETNIENAYLEQIHLFSDMGRDPRGWILSQVYLALINHEKVKLKASDDAAEAAWFQVYFRQKNSEQTQTPEAASYSILYDLILENGIDRLSAEIKEIKEVTNYHEKTNYQIISSQGFAFDHAKIIAYVIAYMRHQIIHTKIAFDLLPDYFTLTDLQRVYEIVMDTKLFTANFRRKIAEEVVETGVTMEGAGHRPSKLYKRKL